MALHAPLPGNIQLALVGMNLMCDADIYPLIPVKKEVKATVSGIYITAVRGLRGPLETPQKKKGFLARMRDKARTASQK